MQRLFFFHLFFVAASVFPMGQPEPTGTLTIAAPRTISSMPLILMDGTVVGGRTVSVELYDDHPLTMAEFLGGRYDALMTGYQLGLGRWKANDGVKLLAVPVWGVSSLVVTDARLHGISSLAGKRVAVPFQGSPLEVQFLAMLRLAGLEGRVKLEYAPITQMPALLLQGRIDAAAMPEPLVSQLVSRGQARSLFSFATEWGRLTGDPRSPQVVVVVRSTGDAKVLNALKTRLGELTETVVSDADVAKVAAALGIETDLVIKALGNTLFSRPTDAETLRLLQAYHDKLKDGTRVTENFFFR